MHQTQEDYRQGLVMGATRESLSSNVTLRSNNRMSNSWGEVRDPPRRGCVALWRSVWGV